MKTKIKIFLLFQALFLSSSLLGTIMDIDDLYPIDDESAYSDSGSSFSEEERLYCPKAEWDLLNQQNKFADWYSLAVKFAPSCKFEGEEKPSFYFELNHDELNHVAEVKLIVAGATKTVLVSRKNVNFREKTSTRKVESKVYVYKQDNQIFAKDILAERVTSYCTPNFDGFDLIKSQKSRCVSVHRTYDFGPENSADLLLSGEPVSSNEQFSEGVFSKNSDKYQIDSNEIFLDQNEKIKLIRKWKVSCSRADQISGEHYNLILSEISDNELNCQNCSIQGGIASGTYEIDDIIRQDENTEISVKYPKNVQNSTRFSDYIHTNFLNTLFISVDKWSYADRLELENLIEEKSIKGIYLESDTSSENTSRHDWHEGQLIGEIENLKCSETKNRGVHCHKMLSLGRSGIPGFNEQKREINIIDPLTLNSTTCEKTKHFKMLGSCSQGYITLGKKEIRVKDLDNEVEIIDISDIGDGANLVHAIYGDWLALYVKSKGFLYFLNIKTREKNKIKLSRQVQVPTNLKMSLVSENLLLLWGEDYVIGFDREKNSVIDTNLSKQYDADLMFIPYDDSSFVEIDESALKIISLTDFSLENEHSLPKDEPIVNAAISKNGDYMTTQQSVTNGSKISIWKLPDFELILSKNFPHGFDCFTFADPVLGNKLFLSHFESIYALQFDLGRSEYE